MAKQAISLNPETFIAGGLISDVDVTIESLRFCLWDYDGKSDVNTLAVKGVLTPIEGGESIEQYWSAGNPESFVPAEDGRKIVPTGEHKSLVKSSNFSMFISSLVNCGMDGGVLNDGDLGVLDGLKAHVVRVPTKREGLPGKKEGGREATVLIASKILQLPWDKKGKKGTSTGTATKAEPAQGGDGEEAVVKLLDAAFNGKEKLEMKVLKIEAMRALPKTTRTEQVKLFADEDWMLVHGYLVEGDTVSKV